MIMTMGLSDNPYAWDILSVVTMNDFFFSKRPNYIKLEEMATSLHEHLTSLFQEIDKHCLPSTAIQFARSTINILSA